MRQSAPRRTDDRAPSRAWRAKRWIGRRRHWVLIVLILVGVVVIYAAAGPTSMMRWLGGNTDELAALQSITQVLFLLGAAVLSYDRFFRGRVFVSRAELILCVNVVATPRDHHLHVIDIRLKNVGTNTIWNPKPELKRRLFGPDEGQSSFASWQPVEVCVPPDGPNSVIDSYETIVFCKSLEVPKACWAVEYEAVVQDDEDNVWLGTTIVPNVPSAPG